MSRRKVLGGLAAGAGVAAAGALAAGCSKEGDGGLAGGGGGDGPPGFGTGINEGFDGTIELDVRDSVADWKPFELKKAPEGAPNILVILYDDTGLAAWSPYGGRINMPVMQKLADTGVMYTQWHTTALCSPTRSCFLTGRSQHVNRSGSITEHGGPVAGAVRHGGAGFAGQRLQHLLVGQEPQRARGGCLQWRQQVGVAAAEGF
jgi:arylsulfatase